MVTDALARIGMDSNVTLGKNYIFYPNLMGADRTDGSLVARTNSTRFEVTQLRYGYSYSMRGTTRQLAAGVLLAHVLIALIHTAVVVWRGCIHSSFTSLFEVLALAINSTPTQTLANTCAGIARLDTYKHVVKIREVSNTHLALVFNNEGGFSPTEGKSYGAPEVGLDLYPHEE